MTNAGHGATLCKRDVAASPGGPRGAPHTSSTCFSKRDIGGSPAPPPCCARSRWGGRKRPTSRSPTPPPRSPPLPFAARSRRGACGRRWSDRFRAGQKLPPRQVPGRRGANRDGPGRDGGRGGWAGPAGGRVGRGGRRCVRGRRRPQGQGPLRGPRCVSTHLLTLASPGTPARAPPAPRGPPGRRRRGGAGPSGREARDAPCSPPRGPWEGRAGPPGPRSVTLQLAAARIPEGGNQGRVSGGRATAGG